ncbi:MAG TPA: Fe-S cluster assembly protein SufD [Acidobacteriota bacterium]
MIEKAIKHEKTNHLLDLLHAIKEPAGEPLWLLQMRRRAARRFLELGIPTVRDEDWKYTNLASLADVPFKPASADASLPRQQLDRINFADLQCTRLVFVNGRYSESLSSPGELDGVKLGSLAEVLQMKPEIVQPHLGQYANLEEHAFNSLNTALMRDGAFVHVMKGKTAEKPIHLLFVSTAHAEPATSHPRNLIVAESQSQATIVESYVSVGPDVYLTNPVTEIILGDGAVLDHYKLQDESRRAFHVATMQYRQDRNSSLRSHSITLGGVLVRNNLTAVLDGEGAECTLNGLYLVMGEQHIDNHTRLEHAKPHCSSRELYKGILDDKSRGVFHGRILVHKGAQKTDSKQTNNNLLLSDEALINTKPQLEIYADDVKCTHGATIGQLDQDAIFYLRSRGIGEKAARSLLIYAFASEIVGRVKVEALRAKLDQFLLGWLPQGELVKGAVQK